MIKATDQVLRADAQAIDRGIKLELNVLGDGDDLRNSKTSRRTKLNDVVRFSGTVPYGKPLSMREAVAHKASPVTTEISRNCCRWRVANDHMQIPAPTN
jgi:hypothetical protein